jgi:Uma2 family endonuclease
MANQQFMTSREYLNTPESLVPTELIYGKLRVADSPLVPHQRVVMDLSLALFGHVQERRVGEVLVAPIDVILDVDRALVVQPDLLFVSNERSSIVTDRIHGAPDLVVEVLSPNPRIGELGERLDWFARYGVRECWLVHQLQRWVEVLNFDDGKVIARTSFHERAPIRSRVLPEFDRTLSSIVRW